MEQGFHYTRQLENKNATDEETLYTVSMCAKYATIGNPKSVKHVFNELVLTTQLTQLEDRQLHK
jgi:hypothetical protein